jgi:hypothetical protein
MTNNRNLELLPDESRDGKWYQVFLNGRTPARKLAQGIIMSK